MSPNTNPINPDNDIQNQVYPSVYSGIAEPVTTKSSMAVISRERVILIQFTGSEPILLLAYSMQSAHIVHEMETAIDISSPVNIVLCVGFVFAGWGLAHVVRPSLNLPVGPLQQIK